jgi:cysteine desulfurase
MGKAFEMASERLHTDSQHCKVLRDTLWDGLRDLPNIRSNTYFKRAVANILNVSLGTLDSQLFLPALSPLAVSSGSACTSATMTPSHVLTSMGISHDHAHSAIRLSVGRYTTKQDIDLAIQKIREVVLALSRADTSTDLQS